MTYGNCVAKIHFCTATIDPKSILFFCFAKNTAFWHQAALVKRVFLIFKINSLFMTTSYDFKRLLSKVSKETSLW
jgi:hypothetical protein